MTVFLQQVDSKSTAGAPDKVYWGCHDSPLGPLILGVTADGRLARLECTSGYGLRYDLSRWQKEWPETEFVPDAGASAALACQLRELSAAAQSRAPLALYGTEFQLKVWRAMLQVKPGEVMSYTDVAALVSKPQAAKAVALAANSNPVSIASPPRVA